MKRLTVKDEQGNWKIRDFTEILPAYLILTHTTMTDYTNVEEKFYMESEDSDQQKIRGFSRFSAGNRRSV